MSSTLNIKTTRGIEWIEREPYKAKLLAQLAQWRRGRPLHLGNPDDKMSECCPDFSCCNRDLLAPVEERSKFLLYANLRDDMLAEFLGRLLRKNGASVERG